MMMPEYKTEYYDYKRAIQDFRQFNNDDAVNKLLYSILGSEVVNEEATPEDFKKWFEENKENYKYETPIIKKIRYNPKKSTSEQSRAARNNMLIDISRSILRHPDTLDKFLNPGSYDNLKKAARVATILDNIDYLNKYVKFKQLELSDDFYNRPDHITDNLKKDISKIKRALDKESLDTLDDFLDTYKKERDPLSLDTFTYYHNQNMVGGALIGIYANISSMQAKFQNSGLRLKIVKPTSPKGKTIDNTFTIDGHRIEELDSIYSPWGERISKNVAEFLAASVDNVKDPVLADLMQNKETAEIAGFMLRAGIPINIISLFFNQPIIKRCIKNYGKLDQEALREELGGFVQGHSSVTTEELMTTILTNDTTSVLAARIATMMVNMAYAAKNLSEITKVCRADSPNGAIAISLGGARNQVQKVTNLRNRAEKNQFAIAGVGRALIKNNIMNTDSSEEQQRASLNFAKIPRLQAFYTLGIEMPLTVMSKFFVQLNQKLDTALVDIYRQSASGYLKDDIVEQYYRDFIEYMLTESPLFGDDGTNTFNEKRDYYLYQFPSEFYRVKRNPKFDQYNIINKIRVSEGNIIFKKSGRLTEGMREALISDFDAMIASEDPEIVQMAIDLFMYSFYKDGYSFGPKSFGNYFSPFFLQSFPEFMNTLREIEVKIHSTDINRFVSQFYNNYWETLVPKITNSDRIMELDLANPDSDIMIPAKLCANRNVGIVQEPYKYINVNGTLYQLKSSTTTQSIYGKATVVVDEQGKKYNIRETVQDMANNQTKKELIARNKTVGAKYVSLEEMDEQTEKLDSQMQGIDDEYSNFLDDDIADRLDDEDIDLDFNTPKYSQEASQEKMGEKFCKKG